MIAGAVAAALWVQQTTAPSPPVRTYVDGFCVPLAGGYASGPRLYTLLSDWKARPGSSADGAALKPEETTVAGQLMRFAAPDAPVAFVEPRSGECTLIWPQRDLPASELDALRSGSLPVGPGGAARRWARVTPVFAGRPPPPKWLMPIGDRADEGVCAVAETDLTRRDGQPASLLRLSACRLSADETVRSE